MLWAVVISSVKLVHVPQLLWWFSKAWRQHLEKQNVLCAAWYEIINHFLSLMTLWFMPCNGKLLHSSFLFVFEWDLSTITSIGCGIYDECLFPLECICFSFWCFSLHFTLCRGKMIGLVQTARTDIFFMDNIPRLLISTAVINFFLHPCWQVSSMRDHRWP